MNKIRERRELSGMSLTQLAEKIDISPSYLSQIERGAQKKKPSINLLREIADALGEPVANLIDGPQIPAMLDEAAEFVPQNGDAPTARAERIAAALGLPRSRYTLFTTRSAALAQLDIRPGDRLLVDLKSLPESGDLVIVNIAGEDRAVASTIVRRFVSTPGSDGLRVLFGPDALGPDMLIDLRISNAAAILGVVRRIIRNA